MSFLTRPPQSESLAEPRPGAILTLSPFVHAPAHKAFQPVNGRPRHQRGGGLVFGKRQGVLGIVPTMGVKVP